MTASETMARERFLRVAAFARQYPQVFAPLNPGSGPGAGEQLLGQLDDVLGDLETSAIVQAGRSSRNQGGEKATLESRIVRDLTGINGSVKFVAGSRKNPELIEVFHLGKLNSDARIIQRGLEFCQCIRQFDLEADLAALNHEPGLVNALSGRIEAFRALGTGRKQSRQNRVGATAKVSELIASGRLLVRGLDALARNSLAEDSEKMAAWKSAMKTPKKPARSKAKKPDTKTESPASTQSTESSPSTEAAVEPAHVREQAPVEALAAV